MASRALEFLELQVRQSRFLALLTFKIDRNIDLGKDRGAKGGKKEGESRGTSCFCGTRNVADLARAGQSPPNR